MRFRALMSVTVVVAASCSFVAGGAASAFADTTGNSFEGSCQLTGDITLDAPLSSELRPTTFTGTGTGTCTGSLNGGPVEDHPTLNQISGLGTLSCAGGHTLTDDVLVFDRKFKIRVFTDTVFGATQAVGHFMGAIAGDGVVEVNLLPYFDESILAQCEAGTLSRVRYDLTARTLTPMEG